jgi:hypothetical protein
MVVDKLGTPVVPGDVVVYAGGVGLTLARITQTKEYRRLQKDGTVRTRQVVRAKLLNDTHGEYSDFCLWYFFRVDNIALPATPEQVNKVVLSYPEDGDAPTP